MAVINRTLDVTEQKKVAVKQTIVGTSTGVGYVLGLVENPMVITDARCYALTLSGAPTATLYVHRYLSGAAATFAMGGALTHVAFGSIGIQQFSLPATGSSLLNLQAGDAIVALTASADAGLAQMEVTVIGKVIQDFKTWFSGAV